MYARCHTHTAQRSVLKDLNIKHIETQVLFASLRNICQCKIQSMPEWVVRMGQVSTKVASQPNYSLGTGQQCFLMCPCSNTASTNHCQRAQTLQDGPDFMLNKYSGRLSTISELVKMTRKLLQLQKLRVLQRSLFSVLE